MIHFSCDGCGRLIDEQQETRYVVRMEVYAAVDDEGVGPIDETDHLEEIEDLLERVEGCEDLEDADDRLYHQTRCDLCPECRERLVNNPLGRGAARLGLSNN